jgi:hypothetical protein
VLIRYNIKDLLYTVIKIRIKDGIMPQEYIEIRGARENNLKDVSLRIPTGIMDDVRKAFAAVNKVSPGTA